MPHNQSLDPFLVFNRFIDAHKYRGKGELVSVVDIFQAFYHGVGASEELYEFDGLVDLVDRYFVVVDPVDHSADGFCLGVHFFNHILGN